MNSTLGSVVPLAMFLIQNNFVKDRQLKREKKNRPHFLSRMRMGSSAQHHHRLHHHHRQYHHHHHHQQHLVSRMRMGGKEQVKVSNSLLQQEGHSRLCTLRTCWCSNAYKIWWKYMLSFNALNPRLCMLHFSWWYKVKYESCAHYALVDALKHSKIWCNVCSLVWFISLMALYCTCNLFWLSVSFSTATSLSSQWEGVKVFGYIW